MTRGDDIPTITISEDKKCAECGQGWAAGNGLCMGCTAKALKSKPMRSAHGKAVQKYMRQFLRSASNSRKP